MSNPPEKHSSRLQECETRDAFARMAHRSTLAQAEAIALHYVANFAYARDLLELVRAQQLGAGHVTFDEVIARLVDELKRNHRHDLGIPLEWKAERFVIRPDGGEFHATPCRFHEQRIQPEERS